MSIVAILIALASLALSFYNMKFSNRIKVAEMRSTLLAKSAELMLRLDRMDRSLQDLKLFAAMNNDNDRANQIVNVESLRKDITKDITHLHRALTSLPLSRTIKAYEIAFSTMQKHSEQILDVEQQVKEVQQKYERLVALRAQLQAAKSEA